jgi:PAS domain S-box-containing protein
MLESKEVGEETLLAALMGISEMMGDLPDLDELLETIVRIAPPLVSVNRCAIFLRNPRTREFRVAHAFSQDSGMTGLLLRLTIPEADVPGLAKKVVAAKIPVMYREGKGDILPEAVVRAFEIKSMLIVPLAYQGEALGFLALDEAGKDHVFTSQQVNVVNAIASHTAVAVVHTRLVEAYAIERRRSEALAETLCDGVITLDPRLRVVSLNRGAESLLGWPSEEAAGRTYWEAFDGEGPSGEGAALVRKVVSGARRVTGKVTLRARDGSRIPCLVTAVAVAGSSGDPVEILFALTRILAVATTQRPGKTGAG